MALIGPLSSCPCHQPSMKCFQKATAEVSGSPKPHHLPTTRCTDRGCASVGVRHCQLTTRVQALALHYAIDSRASKHEIAHILSTQAGVAEVPDKVG